VSTSAPARKSQLAFLRSWKHGPEKGKLKLPPTAQSMLDRVAEAGLAASRFDGSDTCPP